MNAERTGALPKTVEGVTKPRETITAGGFAIIDGGKIDVRSVGPTARFAIVNWLCTKGFMALRDATDQEIAAVFNRQRGKAFVQEIFITAWGQPVAITDYHEKRANRAGVCGCSAGAAVKKAIGA